MSGKNKFKHLLSPLKMGDLELKNRVIMASMTRNRNLVPQQINVDYYTQRANAGLVLTEGTFVAQQGSQWPEAPGIYNDEQVEAWKKVVDSVHQAGGLIFLQLWYVGRVAHPDYELQKQTGKPVPGPSAIAARGGSFHDLPGKPGYITPTAIEDPRTIIEEYAQATRNCKKAGFDGVELHNANGYLPNQFLENHSNKRTDKYGGSVENRMRFSLEILDEIFKVYPPHRVGIKLSPSGGYNDMGAVDENGDTKHASYQAILEQYVPFVKKLDSLKLGYIQIMRPGFGATKYDEEQRGYEDLDIFKDFRPLVKNAKFFANCQYTPEEAEEHIAAGKADAVVFARPYIANPDFAVRIAQGKEIDQRSVEAKDQATWYGHPDGHKEHGYSDYPAVTTAQVSTSA